MKKRTVARRKVYRKRSGATNLRFQRVRNVAGQLSFSSASHYHRAEKMVAGMKQIGAVNNIVNQISNIVTAPAGLQAQYNYGMFDTVALRQMLGSLSGAAPTRLCVQGLTNEYTITNFTNSPLEVDIYDIALKRDIYVGYDFITATDTYIPATFPSSYWNQGLNAQSLAPTTATRSAVIGSQPTDSQLFKDWFKVTKRTTVLLPISGAHRHIVSIKTNRLIDTMLAGVQENISALREFTKFVMFNIKGLPVCDTATVAATTSAAQLGIVSVQRIKYTFTSDFTYSSSLNQSLVTPSAVSTTSYNWGSGANNVVSGLVSLP